MRHVAGQTVIVSVLADTKNAAAGFKDLGDKASGLGTFFKASAATIGIAAVAVGGFVAASIKAAGESEKVAAQTAAVVQSTGAAAGRSAQQISDLAGKLSSLSGIDDEVVQSGENILLTFTNIKGTSFDAATQSALDMSVALGTDMSSAAMQVGKALNDPVAGVSKLTKVGVTFTQQQKDQIAAMQQAGDVAGAQAVILGELQKEFGGSAEAFGNTYEGAVGKVQTAFGNLQENLGAAFLPAVTAIFNKVADVLNALGNNPGFTAFVTNISNWIASLLSGQGAIGGLVGPLSQVLGFLSPLGIAFKVLAPILPQLAGYFQQLASYLGPVLASAAQQILPILQSLVQMLSGVLVQILPTVVFLVESLAQVFSSVLAAALPVVISIIQTLIGVLQPIISAILPPLVSLFTMLAQIITTSVVPIIMMLVPVIGQIFTALAPVIQAVGELVGALLSALMPILQAILVPIIQLASTVLSILLPPLQFIISVAAAIVTGIVNVITFLVKLATGNKDAGKIISDVWNGILNFFGQIPGKVGALFSGAINWLADAGKNIIQGLLNGAGSLLKNIGSFFLNMVPGWIKGPFMAALGIHSPSRVFAGFGKNIVGGLEQGLLASNNIDSIMTGLSDQVSTGFNATLDAPTGYRAAALAGGGSTYNVNFNGIVGSPVEAGRQVSKALREFERVGGGR